MDEHVDDVDELEANLHDIAFANARLGGIGPVVRALRRVPVRTVLDVGSGLGDVARALVRDAARRGIALEVTCLDRSEAILALARRAAGGDRSLTFVRGDGTALPFEPGAFDVTLCTLALHHFDGAGAPALLRELRRVARLTPIVCDLRRSALAYAGTWLWTRTTRNRLTRHDGPLSVRRAYTPAEALALARDAGWRHPQVRLEPFFRMTMMDAGVP
jgi:ubiquinone/menaquinone biosynthesis C-methylase UbiE